MQHIEIYGQSGCRYCALAMRYLEAFQLPVVYRDIAESNHRREMFARNPDAATVPQIFIGDTLIGGHDQLVVIPLSQLQQMIGGQ